MRRAPPLSHVLSYPVTAHVGAAAISLSLARFGGVDVSFLEADYHAGRGEPWRFLSSALPHGNIFHLIFNLYWLWAFGTIVEERLGALRTAAIYLLFAAGSAAAEFAVFRGGIGLSGVVYGLFGMLWLLSRRDVRFAGGVDYHTSALLVFWFFFCILLTIANVLPVANVAHGAGALLGWLLGWAMSARTARLRALWWAGLAAVVALIFIGAHVARPYINLSPSAARELARGGFLELKAGRPERAAALLRDAVRIQPRDADYWHFLGRAYEQLGRGDEAEDAFRRERRLRPPLDQLE